MIIGSFDDEVALGNLTNPLNKKIAEFSRGCSARIVELFFGFSSIISVPGNFETSLNKTKSANRCQTGARHGFRNRAKRCRPGESEVPKMLQRCTESQHLRSDVR